MLPLLVAAVLMASAPAATAPQATNVGEASQDGLQPGERRVKMKCRTEAINGSRVLKRRCMPLEEWKRLEEESAKTIQELQGRSPVIPTCQQSAMRPC